MHYIPTSCILFMCLFIQTALHASNKNNIKCISSSRITATLQWLSEYQDPSHALPEHLTVRHTQTPLVNTSICQQTTSILKAHDQTPLVTIRAGLGVNNDGSIIPTYCCLSFSQWATPDLFTGTPIEPLITVLRYHQRQNLILTQNGKKPYQLYIVPEIISNYQERNTRYPFLRGYFTVEEDQRTLQCVYRMQENHHTLLKDSSSSDSDTESTHSEDHGVTDSSHDSIPPSSKRAPFKGNRKDLL